MELFILTPRTTTRGHLKMTRGVGSASSTSITETGMRETGRIISLRTMGHTTTLTERSTKVNGERVSNLARGSSSTRTEISTKETLRTTKSMAKDCTPMLMEVYFKVILCMGRETGKESSNPLRIGMKGTGKMTSRMGRGPSSTTERIIFMKGTLKMEKDRGTGCPFLMRIMKSTLGSLRTIRGTGKEPFKSTGKLSMKGNL